MSESGTGRIGRFQQASPSRISRCAEGQGEDAATGRRAPKPVETADGRIIERDRLRDTVEVYDTTGRRHLGEFDPWDGRQVGPPEPTRSVEP